eukprot:gene13262-13370_t
MEMSAPLGVPVYWPREGVSPQPVEPDLGHASGGKRFSNANSVRHVPSNWGVHMLNQSLNPIPKSERVLDLSDYASLWGSLGVGLLVMLAGASLLPALSLAQALGAILVGTVLGAALLGYIGRIGAATGLSSAGLIRPTLGRGLAWMPIALNILQLIGWALFEIIVMRDGLSLVLAKAGIAVPVTILTLLVGLVLAGLLALAMTGFVRRFIRGIGVSLMGVALVWLTLQVLRSGFSAGWDNVLKAGDGSMTFAGAIDLVIAMPISWAPLIADYTRYAKVPNRAFAGSALGYGLANGWCFGLGVVLAALNPGADMMAAIILLPVGAGALGLILIDEMDNGYSDLYSAAVSGHSLVPQIAVRHLGPILAVLGTLVALWLPIANFSDFLTKYQDFLYLIGAVFLPLFVVVIAHFQTQAGETERAFVWPAIFSWLVGFVLYEAMGGFASLQAITGLQLPQALAPFGAMPFYLTACA